MKGNKNVKTLARKAITLQGKILKAIEAIRGAENWLEMETANYAKLPESISEARAQLAELQQAVDSALEALSKPLDEYRYESRYYSPTHAGPRRYSSPAAQTAWDATRQADRSADYLASLEASAAKGLDGYTAEARGSLAAAWSAWNNANALFGATMARIRTILKRDVIDLSALAKDAPKVKSQEPEICKLHHVDSPYITVHASEMYKAARAIRITKLSNLPVLNHVLVRVTDMGVKLFTRTLEEDTARVETVNCWADGVRWETCVPAKAFTDWLQVMADDRDPLVMDFDPSVQVLQIKAGNSRTEFKCLDACEFPPC